MNKAEQFKTRIDYLGSDVTARFAAELKALAIWHERPALIDEARQLLAEAVLGIAELEQRAAALADDTAAKEQRLQAAQKALAEGARRIDQTYQRGIDEYSELEAEKAEAESEYSRAGRQSHTAAADLARAQDAAKLTRAHLRMLEAITEPETPLIDLIRGGK